MKAALQRRGRQWISRLPGAGRLRRWAVQRVRGSATMRSLARRTFAIDGTAPVPPDVAPGNVLGGVGTESLPVVLVVAFGADEQTLEDVVDEVARLQLLGAGFRPVFVTDRPAFRATRRYAYPTELLMDASSLEGDATWEEYARDRVALLLDTYRATASVTVGPDGLDDAARVVLSALRSTVPSH